MKYRIGFVTNSSSSSYICCYCGDVSSGWDCGLKDVDMCTCENGHILCLEHVELDITEKDKKNIVEKFYKEEMEYYKKEKEADPDNEEWAVKKINEINEVLDAIKMLKKGKCVSAKLLSKIDEVYDVIMYDVGIPAEYCPVCQFESLPDFEILRYLEKKYGIKQNEILKEIRESFSTYKEFQREILWR